MEELILRVVAVAVPAIFAITLHEAAHGWMASKLGDDTALRMGRVSFNPLRHVDPFGTIVLPALMYFSTGYAFGWAKPVPVNFGRLNRPRRDMVLVALAGPGINLILAILSAWLWRFLPEMAPMGMGPWVRLSLEVSLLINVILMVFNMIPMPPLDGGRVAVGLLPLPLARPLAGMEKVGLLVLIGVMFLLPMLAKEFGYRLDIMGAILGPPVDWVIEMIGRLTGNL